MLFILYYAKNISSTVTPLKDNILCKQTFFKSNGSDEILLKYIIQGCLQTDELLYIEHFGIIQ